MKCSFIENSSKKKNEHTCKISNSQATKKGRASLLLDRKVTRRNVHPIKRIL